MAFVYDGAKKGSDIMRKNSVTGLKKIKNTMRAAIQRIRMARAGNETVNGEVWARRNRLEDEETDRCQGLFLLLKYQFCRKCYQFCWKCCFKRNNMI